MASRSSKCRKTTPPDHAASPKIPHSSLCDIGALDNLHVDLPEDFANGGLKDRPLIAAVGIELQQEWMQAKQCGHHQNPAGTILDVRRMHEGVEEQSLGID